MKSGNEQAKAVCVVESSMRAFGIDCRLPKSPEEGDLVINGKRVKVGGPTTNAYDFVVDAKMVLGSSVAAKKAEIYRLTEFVGAGKPEGFRNVSGTERARSGDYEATSMRLTPFGRTLNPTEADMKRWAPYAKREAQRASFRYAATCQKAGATWEDLYSIGLVFLVNFLDRHRSRKNDKADAAYLTFYLQQEFRRWAQVTAQRNQNVTPVLDGLPVDLVVGAPCGNATFADEGAEAAYSFDLEAPEAAAHLEPVFASAEEAERYERKRLMQEGRYKAQRQRNAVAALEDGLSGLSHSQFVEAMARVMTRPEFDADAKEEAQRRFQAHLETCEECRCADEAWTEEDKNARARMSAKRGRKPTVRRTIGGYAVGKLAEMRAANEEMGTQKDIDESFAAMEASNNIISLAAASDA